MKDISFMKSVSQTKQSFKFYLGTHEQSWLYNSSLNVPVFMSHRRLARLRSLRPATTTWALDSGGFSELSLYGEWRTSAHEYLAAIRRYESEIGKPEFCAIQDYMCEPHILKKTGMTIKQHQLLTCHSFIGLKSLAPDINFIPILQGWDEQDYHNHIKLYREFNIDLRDYDIVGVGSVCRRQNSNEIENLIRSIYLEGIRIHGFGVKSQGLERYSQYLVSADSMAWSFSARYDPPLEGCTHKNCSNCIRYALRWYNNLVRKIGTEKFQV